MKRMFRIQRMFQRRTAVAILAGGLLLLSSLPAAAAGRTERPVAARRGFLAEVASWLGGRVEAGISLIWGEGGSSFDPNGGTSATTGDGGSSFDPNGRPGTNGGAATTSGDCGSSIDPNG